ncbi:MAG: PHP domain-containing protein [Candidatus Lokiarchaeota archaeon]|nr:PHP domain-containing protein [Candidatus Lokiarchaeota archaeon]
MKIEFPKLNLHIHSNYSDGRNSIGLIVMTALKTDLDYICITDHFTDSWKADHIPNLNNLDKIKRYLEELTEFKEFLVKENKKLTLFKGIEIDLSSSEKFIINNISPNKFDFILFEYLESFEGIAFLRKILNYWKKKNYNDFPLIGLAHFDPSFFITRGLDTLLAFLKQYDLIIEFNSSYPQFYSSKYEVFFRKLKESSIKVSIGCDSHHLSTLKDIEGPYAMIEFYNLEENFKSLIESLVFKKSLYLKK